MYLSTDDKNEKLESERIDLFASHSINPLTAEHCRLGLFPKTEYLFACTLSRYRLTCSLNASKNFNFLLRHVKQITSILLETEYLI